MKRSKKKILYHIVNIVSIAMIVECFLCAMLLVKKNAEENSLDRIQETTRQVSAMFRHEMNTRQEKMGAFADILSANSGTPEELLETYMENFCKTQAFAAICVQRWDGYSYSYGEHPHEAVKISSFEKEVARLPYVSSAFSNGTAPEDSFIYQAVPVIRDGKTYAVLYGYTALSEFPNFIASTAYEGKCRFYIVDGDTGDFLMNEQADSLGNLFENTLDTPEIRKDHDLQEMRLDMEAGKDGFFVFRNPGSEDWYYAYYMPMGINNWSMHMALEESTVFETYRVIAHTMLLLMVVVIVLIVVLIISLMTENSRVDTQRKAQLHKSNFINSVQHSLLNAYSNTDAIIMALRTIAEEYNAETALLLSFSENIVTDAQYWPSSDKAQAMDLMGRNIREAFPVLYDQISTGSSMVYDKNDPVWDISATATEIFKSLDVSRILLVPILDTSGRLKGAISAVNPDRDSKPELIESVVYDFFMAITNLESHNIVKKMGAYDYLTGLKNRNSFEVETAALETIGAESLWCAYVDVNGLHELNNQKGHKAGDLMLCAVASAIKKIFGEEWAYRLGGDEFVAFKIDSSHEEFMSFKYRLLDELAKKGYSVSVGFEGTGKNRNNVFDVDKILEEAEAIMYRDKWAYYEKNGISTERSLFMES